MSSTFAELGIPFPLYEAPVSTSTDFAGSGTCCVCGAAEVPCFHIDHDYLIAPCPSCDTDNALDVYRKAPKECRSCGSSIGFPESVASRKEPKICYACLRSGKAALKKDTEFGLIAGDQLFEGVTLGIPGLKQDQFESVVLNPDGDWKAARIPRPIMEELSRTPSYNTWQGEFWLFCCRYPMTFVGEWTHDDFDARAPDGDGENLFSQLLPDLTGSCSALGHALFAYVFECKQCGKLRAHYDCD